MIKNTLKLLTSLSFAAVLSVAAPIMANAASTDWQLLEGGKIRMLAAPLESDDAKAWGITIEIELNEGWKTYWKNPGSSGVPPQFNWDKSRNLKAAPQVHFPTPKIIKDPSGVIIGYKHHVAFTTKAVPEHSTEPMSVDLTALLGICSDICIPVKVELQLNNLMGEDKMALEAYKDAQKALPLIDSAELKILTISQDKPNQLMISTKVPASAKDIALLPFGANGWYLFPAKLVSRDGDIATFTLDITDIPKDGDASKTPIEYTLIADDTSIALQLTSTP